MPNIAAIDARDNFRLLPLLVVMLPPPRRAWSRFPVIIMLQGASVPLLVGLKNSYFLVLEISSTTEAAVLLHYVVMGYPITAVAIVVG